VFLQPEILLFLTFISTLEQMVLLEIKISLLI